jgi:glycosyltransferase involved in cell wall biosynthesis
MHLAFETSSMLTNRPTGIARYITNLIRNISIQKNHEDYISLFYKLSRFKNRHNLFRLNNTETSFYYNSLWPLKRDADIFHGLDGYVPNWKRTKRLVTIHDLAAIKLNDNDVSSSKFRHRKEQTYTQVFKYVDAIITDSESTKRDIIEFFNFNEDRIYVTHLGVGKEYYARDKESTRQALSKYAINKNYLLFVGGVSSRKNTRRMIQAYARSKNCHDVEFVFAGGVSYQGESTLQEIKKQGLEKRVKILDYVNDADLPALYTGAAGLVFPTLYEGFGLPILEAMACGTPVLTADVGAAPEISDKWAIHVNPYDVDEIAQGIDMLLESPPGSTEDWIRHAKQFTWKSCAKNTLAAYEKVLCS